MIIAIDPGTTRSAFVVIDERESLPMIIEKGIVDNNDLVSALRPGGHLCQDGLIRCLYIEMVASYGMAVGRSVFETCVWIGRFAEAWGDAELIYRKDVKIHLCGQTRAKDSNIRQAIMDKYGSERSIAIGTKKQPGPLYGVSKDIWAALGVALTATKT